MRKLIAFATTLSLAASAALAQSAAETSAALKELADGRPVKLVWIQDAGPTACTFSEKPTLKLMGFDTEDGLGERVILDELSQYSKPLITDDGTRVVYGDPSKGGIFIVDFKGGAPRKILADASFMDVWEDPRDHVEWIYASEKVQRGGKEVSAIYRHRLDDPSVSELVWDKTGCYHFMVNGDGRAASGGGDGGNSPQGVFFLPNRFFAQRAGGCWPAMCPDDSLRSWVFTGNHRSIHFCFTTDRSGKGSSWGVRFDRAPGLEIKGNEEMYHPRWSNHPRFLTLTSPFSHWQWAKEEGKIPNEVAAGVEVYFGKFTEDFHDIERWVKVSHNERGDYWPDAWVKPDVPPAWLKERPSDLPDAEEGAAGAKPDIAGTVYAWADGTTDNQLVDPDSGAVTQCGGRFLRSTCLAQGSLLDLNSGAFIPDGAAERWLAAVKKSRAASFELAITPSVVPLKNHATILDFGDNARLVQIGDSLKLSLRGLSYPIDLPATLKAGVALHLAVSLSDADGLAIFIDGQRVLVPVDCAKATPAAWQDAQLVLGDSAEGNANWPGRMESIAFLGRSMALPEARLRCSAWRERAAARAPAAKRLVVEALLVDDCEPADPLGIAPYKRCLSVRHYQITHIHEGQTEDKDINVAQWSVLDGEVFAPYLDYKPGNTYRLTLEPWEAHPEQESERMTMGDEVDVEVPFYYQPPAIVLPSAAETSAAPQLWKQVEGQRKNGGIVLQAPLSIRNEREPKPFAVDFPGELALDTDGQPVTIDSETFQFSIDRKLHLGGSGAVAGVAVVKGGSDVPSHPNLVFEGEGKGARAEAILGVDSLEIVRLGTGFTDRPVLEFDPPEIYGGTPPNVQVFIDNKSGAIDNVIVMSPGSGYTRIPRVRIVGDGTGAEIQAHMKIVGVHVIDGGSGYTSMPKVTVEGAPDAILQAVSQETLLRYRGSQSNAIVENNADVDQDGSQILYDWAADGNNTGNREFRNKGKWRMHNGAIIGFMTSTGRGLWVPWFQNDGAFALGAGCNLALHHVRNNGEMTLEAPAQIGLADAWGSEDTFFNFGKLRVIGADAAKPVVFGWTGPGNCGKRALQNGSDENAATLAIENGGAFRVVGNNTRVDNSAGSIFALLSGGALEIITSDNGSTHLFNNREALFVNAVDAKFRFAGRLVVQGNHGGRTGVSNAGQMRIEDGAELERLPNSSGQGSFYKADANSSLIENLAGGVVSAKGSFSYVNSTGVEEGRMLLFRNAGTLEVADAFAMNDVNLSFKGEGENGEAILRVTLGKDAAAAPLTLRGTADDTGVVSVDGESATALEIVVPQGMQPHGRYRIIDATKISGAFKAVRVVGNNAACAAELSEDAKSLDVIFQ